jgi:ribosomal-protein-alanine N-acetyltransferase
MGARQIHLPDDLETLARVTPECFQYPENPAWSVQQDEVDAILDSIESIRRVWPILRLLQTLSPPLRDLMLGFFWEEDQQAVGTILVQRRGTTDKWSISNVGVLPAYRRRGIARQLMRAGMDLIRQRGGSAAILDVIAGNLPAQELYLSLGFEDFGGSIEFQFTPKAGTPLPSLPEGYCLQPLSRQDWRTRLALDERILPSHVRKYEPVEIGRYRLPLLAYLFIPILNAAQKAKEADYMIIRQEDGLVVGRGGYNATQGKGVSDLRLRVDPAYPEIADYLAQLSLHHIASLAPGKRIEASIPQWMAPSAAALDKLGFERRMVYCRMGVLLSS